MEPPVDTRLQSMIRAVRDVIMPALEDRDGLAHNQAGLLVTHLETVRRQIDHLPRYYELEFRSAALLARELVDAVSGGPMTTASGLRLRAILDELGTEPPAAPAALRDATESLNAAGEDLVRAAAVDAEPHALQALTVRAVAEGRASAGRQLAWCGADTDPAAVLDGWDKELQS